MSIKKPYKKKKSKGNEDDLWRQRLLKEWFVKSDDETEDYKEKEEYGDESTPWQLEEQQTDQQPKQDISCNCIIL